MKKDVLTLIDTYEAIQDDKLRFELGLLVRKAVNRWTFGNKTKQNYLTMDEISYLKDGKKIEAIKSVKNRLNLSLLEGKRYVEKHMGPYYVAPASYSSFLQS